MASLRIQKFDGVLVQSDLECEGSISCRHGVFIGNLLVTDRNGFKVFRRKDTVPSAVKHLEDDDTTFYVSDADSCVEWYKKMLLAGRMQNIGQVFPPQHIYDDFSEIDYSQEIELLKERLDALDLVNMLDAEFVAALQSGGAAYVEIANQVSVETSARQSADTSQVSRLDAIETAGWVTAARCHSDVAIQSELDAESTARQQADTSQVSRLDAIETAGWVTAARCHSDVAIQSELDAESTARQSADTSQVSRLDAIETAGWVTAARCHSDVAIQSELDAESTARQQGDATLTSAITTEKDRLDALFLAGGMDFDTIKEISDAFGQVQSTGLSQAIASNTSGVAQNVSDIATKAANSDVVKLTGAQTIAGVKEFSSQITGSISGSSGTVQSLTGTNLINTLSDSSTFLRMIPAERTKVGYVDIGKAVSTLDQDDVGDGTSYKRLSAAKKTLLDSVTDAGSGVIVSASERAKIAYVDIGKAVSTLDQDDVGDGTSYKRLSAAKKTLLDGISDAGSGVIVSASERAKIAYVDIGKAVSTLDQDDVGDGTSYKRLSAAKKTLLDSVTDAGSGVIVSASERAKIAYVDIGKAVSTLDQDDVGDGTSYKRLSAAKKTLLDGISDAGSGVIVSASERAKIAYVDIGKAVSTLDQDDVADGTSYKRLSAVKKTLLDSVTDAGSGVIVSASERAKIAYVDIGKAVSTLDQDDVGDGTSYKRLSAAKKTLLDSVTDAGSGVIVSASERAKIAYVDTGGSLSTALAAKHDALNTSSLYHDTNNHRLGVGTTSPENEIHIHGTNPDLRLSSDSLSNKSFQMGFDGSGGHPFNMSLNLDHKIQFKTAGGDARMTIDSSNVTCKQDLIVDQKTTTETLVVSADHPNTSGTAGTQHEIRVDDSYIYVKTSGAWKRISLSTATW